MLQNKKTPGATNRAVLGISSRSKQTNNLPRAPRAGTMYTCYESTTRMRANRMRAKGLRKDCERTENMNRTQAVLAAIAAATLGLTLGPTIGTVVHAQDKTSSKMSDKRDKMNATMDARMGSRKGQEKSVYVDPDEKEFYTPAQAIMTGYMNEAGKKLVRRASIPTSYKPTDDIGKMYIDPDEKEYYTPTQAKMTGYKNENGKKLVKMEKMPVGYKPTDDMGKMNKRKKTVGKRGSVSGKM